MSDIEEIEEIEGSEFSDPEDRDPAWEARQRSLGSGDSIAGAASASTERRARGSRGDFHSTLERHSRRMERLRTGDWRNKCVGRPLTPDECGGADPDAQLIRWRHIDPPNPARREAARGQDWMLVPAERERPQLRGGRCATRKEKRAMRRQKFDLVTRMDALGRMDALRSIMWSWATREVFSRWFIHAAQQRFKRRTRR